MYRIRACFSANRSRHRVWVRRVLCVAAGKPCGIPTTCSGDEERAARCRKAADLAMEQLDWIISYLHRIRKHEIARALQRNRTSIAKRYRGD